MSLQQQMLGIFSETHVHVGAGQMLGAVDLPVAREKITEYPYIPGSSLKGALREKIALEVSESQANTFFGDAGNAAGIGVSDGRLLLLPIRSLSGHFRWVTSPFILERFLRDLRLLGITPSLPSIEVSEEQAWVMTSDQVLFLEELSFQAHQMREKLEPWIQLISKLIAHPTVVERLNKYLTLVSDEDFATLTQMGLFIYARNVLDDVTKQSKNFWYEEAISPDTLFYSLLFARTSSQADDLVQFLQILQEQPYLQVGGNETIGQGVTIVSPYEGVTT